VLRTLGADYEYGNARARAMTGDLLDRVAYDALLGLDVDGLLAALAEGPYGPDVHAATRRHEGLPALHATVSTHLARNLRSVRGFYGGRAAAAVDLLLARWDLHNAVTILRGQARHATAEETLPLLVPVGALDEHACAELAGQPGFRATVDLMLDRGLPTRPLANALRAAAPAYERSGDLAPVEHALARADGAQLDRSLADLADLDDEEGAVLGAVLRGEVDRHNLLLALRLREGGVSSTTPPANPFVPGGRIPVGRLAAIAETQRRLDVDALLRATPATRPWGAVVAGWARDGDLTALERETEAAATRHAFSLLWRADALGIGVPVAFVAAAENEARNLRLLAYGAASGIPAELLRARLVVVR